MKKDFFISYTDTDNEYATWIASMLEESGYTVIIQEWDFRPGDNIPQKIDESLKICNKMITVISQKYFESGWCQAEWTNMYYKMVYRGERLIIPVRIEPINIDGLLGGIFYIDLVDCNKEEAFRRIINGIKDEVDRKPTGDFPISYDVEHLEITNTYEVYDSFIIYKKTCRTKVLNGGKNMIHTRITWFQDEEIEYVSLTDGVHIERVYDHDTNTNFNVVFDHILNDEEEVIFSFRMKLYNTNGHFKDFFSTEIITPTRLLNYKIDFKNNNSSTDIFTQILSDSPMNKKSEKPQKCVYRNPFVWNVINPKLHFEYKVFWEKEA